MLQIFISYRRDDTRQMAERITKTLRDDGYTVFLDVSHSMRAGKKWDSEILKALFKADVILIVIGEQWLDILSKNNLNMRRIDEPKDWVRREVKFALDKDQAEAALVIPLLINNTSMPVEDSLPDDIRGLAGLQGLRIRNEPDFENDITNLKEEIRHYEAILVAGRGVKRDIGTNPEDYLLIQKFINPQIILGIVSLTFVVLVFILIMIVLNFTGIFSSDELPIGKFSNVLDEARGVFTGQSEDGESIDIYIFADGEYYALFPNTPENEYQPIFRGPDDIEIAYLRETYGEVVLVYYLPPFHEYIYSAPDGYTFDTSSRIARHPNHPIVYVTLLDKNGQPYIYQFNLDDSKATPILSNARNPVLNETHLIYEHVNGSGTTIEVQLIYDGLINDVNGSLVSSLPKDATNCYSPAPYKQDEVLFICDNVIYLGSLFSFNTPSVLYEADAGVNIANVAFVPDIEGYYLTFDDGTTIYLLDIISGEVTEFLRVSVENTSNMNWR